MSYRSVNASATGTVERHRHRPVLREAGCAQRAEIRRRAANCTRSGEGGALERGGDLMTALPNEAYEILEQLRERSPCSTKVLRAEAGLRGRTFESLFIHSMKALWSRLLIVGAGEVQDGAFPSLAIAATEMMFEDIWAARGRAPRAALAKLDETLGRVPAFAKQFARNLRAVRDANVFDARSVGGLDVDP